MPEHGQDDRPFPPPMHAIDHGAHQRIAVLENQMNRLNLQLDKLETKFDTLQVDVTAMKSGVTELGGDMKWMKGQLMPLVRGSDTRSKSADDRSNTAKFLSIIGVLVALLAGVLGIANIPNFPF